MTPEQKAAHEKLLATLPSRIHALSFGPEPKPATYKKPGRPVVVDGIRYPSMGEAEQATGYSRQLIYWWISQGKDRARYADDL